MLIGLLPGYDRIGPAAPVLLTLLRFAQGVGVGGEWGGAVLLALESGHRGRRGFYASWPQAGVPLGLLASTGVFALCQAALPEDEFLSWGWRVPFWLSAALIVVGLVIRARVLDTWKPEPMIRFENQYLANPHRKDYDAIVTLRIDDRESVFNLEYERTAKRYRDYADIRDLWEQVPNLDPVLYVVPDLELLRVLRHAFHRTSAPVHICLAGDFNDSFMDMRVTDASSGVIRSVAAIL